MKKSMTKRLLAFALGLCMTVSSLAPAYASESKVSEVSVAAAEAKASASLVGNASFEDADLTAKAGENYVFGTWYSFANAVRVKEEAHTGDYCIKVDKNDMAVEQDLDGSKMEAGTVYTARVWAKTQNPNQSVHFGVKNFGGTETRVKITSTEYKEYEVPFTYESGNPRIYIWAEAAGSAVYADDFSVVSSEHIEDFAISNGEILVQFAEDYEDEISADLFELSLTTVDGTNKVDLRQGLLDDKTLVMRFNLVEKVPVEQTVTAALTYKPTGKVYQSTFTVESNGEAVIAAEIASLTAKNGSVVAVLKDVPTVAPVKEDFTLQYKVDDGAYKVLSVKGFAYDKAAKTVTFDVVSLAVKADPQEVTVKVTCGGKDKEASYTLEMGDGTVYYVDATEGNDANDGKSPEKAWKSIEKVNATTFQPGDQILFQCGETWTGELMPLGSGVEGCPIVIASYGEGDKPVFKPGPDRTLKYFNVANDVLYNVSINNGISFTNQEHWEVRDLEFYDPGYATTNPRYTYTYRRAINLIAEDVGDLYGFTFDNLTIHGYRGPNTNRGKSSGGLIVSILSDPYNAANRVPTAIHDISVTNCTMYELGRSGFNFCSPWTTRVDVEEDDWGLFGYSGYGEWKPCENIYIANNVIHDIDGDGVLIDGCKDVLVEHNTVYRCAFNSDFAVGMFNWNSDNTVFQYNEVYDTCPADREGAEADAQGIEIDALNRDTWVQYNYVHDNRGGVFMWCNTNDLRGFRGVYRYNISQNDGFRHGIIDWRPNHMYSEMYNNTVYITGDTAGTFLNSNGGNVAYNAKFYNNIFYNLNKKLSAPTFLEDQIDWKNNIFYGFDNMPSDDSNMNVDPLFVDPGKGEYGRDSVDGYKLQDISPAIDAGINIENNGGQDYFGTPLTDGMTDIGAAEWIDENSSGAANKTALEAKVKEYADVDTSGYEADRVAAFEEALAAAQAVLAKEDATQKEVNAALATLKDAYLNLEEQTKPSDTLTYPSVMDYQATSGTFSLLNSSRFVIITNSQSLKNEVLENDLKLLSSEFVEKDVTEKAMNIVYGSEETAKPGDIVIRLEAADADSNPEGYEISIDKYAEVVATSEAGIFYGVRTIQKAMILNNGAIDRGYIKDEPAVPVRGYHLDTARKMFTKEWILAQIKDLSYQNINTIQFHFSENEGYRLESSTLEAIDGWSYPRDGYHTKEDMLEIIKECQKYHIELVPSLDSPGHMTYVLDRLPSDWDCYSLWPGDFRSTQCFNIFEKQECRDFLKDLFTEYAEFFSEAGCKHINIGGDEFLNNFGSMTDEQYITVMDYFNEISALVKSYGLTPRAWNDGLMFGDYTGYELDPDIEICYWAGPENCAPIKKFVDNGNKIINMCDTYMYYVLGSWWMSAANPAGDRIFGGWHPGQTASSETFGPQTEEYPYPEYLIGASFAIWCDTPSMLTEGQIATNTFMRTRAMAEKSWNPNSAYAYNKLEAAANTLGHAPGYDGTQLPSSGDVLYEGDFGTIVLKYVDKDGKAIAEDKAIYGLVDDPYSIEADVLYGYRFVSMDKASEGKFTDGEIVITLTYELYTDRYPLYEALISEKAEKDYIPATYAEYKDALKAAKLVYNKEGVQQAEVDAALEALLAAEKKLVSIDLLDLYMEVTYPIGSAGYTAGSYEDYQAALNTAKAVLAKADPTEEEIEDALNELYTAKEDLVLASADGFITVTATDEAYWAGDYKLSNMLDNNMNSYAWLADEQHTGDEVKFTFASPVKLNSFRYQAPADADLDIFANAVVEISADGQNWTEIGTLKAEADKTIDVNGESVQYVRIRSTVNDDHWVKLAEVSFDYEAEPVDKTVLDNAIASAADLKKEDYTEASWEVLQKALANAEAVKEKGNAGNGEILAAVAAIEGAIDALTAPSEDDGIVINPPENPTPAPSNPFEDVVEGQYYYDPVLWAVEKGITTGQSATIFGVNVPTKREDVVTFLWRYAGSPNPTQTSCTFEDVEPAQYYYNAILWANENGIVSGYNTDKFGVGDTCKREDIVKIFWGYAGKPEPGTDTCDFEDVKTGEYYYSAVLWAVEKGITTGQTVTRFGVGDSCTRQDFVTFLHRYSKL